MEESGNVPGREQEESDCPATIPTDRSVNPRLLRCSALLGVAPGCTADELAHAYHQKMSQWHPDKLETMAPELKDYATRQTQRINEAYQKVKSTTGQNCGK
jgi:preprotein translocase subunit Sec63